MLFLVLNNLTNYGRRHSKLFNNYHVSWDTLFILKQTKLLRVPLRIRRVRLCLYGSLEIAILEECKSIFSSAKSDIENS